MSGITSDGPEELAAKEESANQKTVLLRKGERLVKWAPKVVALRLSDMNGAIDNTICGFRYNLRDSRMGIDHICQLLSRIL